MIDKILLLIEMRGLTQDRLESLAGLSHGRISKWKGDTGEPSGSDSLAMARALGVSVEWLLDDRMGGEPVASGGTLPDDQRTLLKLYHALGLDVDEALRRLSRPAASGLTTGREVSGA